MGSHFWEGIVEILGPQADQHFVLIGRSFSRKTALAPQAQEKMSKANSAKCSPGRHSVPLYYYKFGRLPKQSVKKGERVILSIY